MTQTRRTGALLFLALLFLLSAQIGNNFKQILMIFSIFMWVIAAALFVYLILFRGVKVSFFSNWRKQEPANDLEEMSEESSEPVSSDEAEGADVVTLRPPVA